MVTSSPQPIAPSARGVPRSCRCARGVGQLGWPVQTHVAPSGVRWQPKDCLGSRSLELANDAGRKGSLSIKKNSDNTKVLEAVAIAAKEYVDLRSTVGSAWDGLTNKARITKSFEEFEWVVR